MMKKGMVAQQTYLITLSACNIMGALILITAAPLA